MPTASPHRFAVLLALVACPALAALRPPVALSPGAPAAGARLAQACPTFTWTGGDPGAAIELALWRVDETGTPPAGGDESEPDSLPDWVLRLPAGATAWSAAGERCLAEPGGYQWRVRGAFGAERSPWSAPLRFEAPDLPSPEQIARALELLERWQQAQAGAGGPGARGGVPQAAAGAHAELAGRPRALLAPALAAPLGTSPPLGAAAVEAELPDTAVETYGVLGTSNSTESGATGVVGYSPPLTGFGTGVFGRSESNAGWGVYGEGAVGVNGTATVDGSNAVQGINLMNGATIGVYGLSVSGTGAGVGGENNALTGPALGVFGSSSSPTGRGVWGDASNLTGAVHGVHGEVSSTAGTGVYGNATAASGFTYGVYGLSSSTSGAGTYGAATATSGTPYGVVGYAAAPAGVGASGWGASTTGANVGLYGLSDSTTGTAVRGFASTTTGANVGVEGRSASASGKGVWARASSSTGTNYGLYAETVSAAGYAGYFLGRVEVAGSLNVTGMVSKGGGSFRIDHPLDPENRYLLHSFVESPDMMNLYNGIVALDDAGGAWVELPAWFEPLNRDFRYHLTPLGRFAPLYVAEEIAGGRFRIGGGIPGQRVSWLVTGIRQDPFANRHRIPVELDKPARERGTYLHPEAYGLGPEWAPGGALGAGDEAVERPADPPRPQAE